MLQLPPLNKIAVSACLVGNRCRYDGKASDNMEQFKDCLCFCPEQLGGLSTPRTPCEIENGNGNDVLCGKARVVDSAALDRTAEFIQGASIALKICLENSIEAVILKEKSPSCGCRSIYNHGKIVEGSGVMAALLKKNNIKIISDKEIVH